MLLDNTRALVKHHDAATREVAFNERLHALARYWACGLLRVRRIARTKGKDERGVGYVKHNAIAGRSFASWAHWRRTWRPGCAKSQTSGCIARRARRRLHASSARSAGHCGR